MARNRTLRLATFVLGVAALFVLVGCDASTESSNPSSGPGALPAAQPAIRIDPTWKSLDGNWTFTAQVDPQGDSTDVILEIGPGPANARVFDHHVAVARGLTVPSPVTVSTTEIPDIDEICVRFSATNSSGTSVTSPLCFPHDLPSFVPQGGPPVTTFSAPASGTTTVITTASFSVTWTESAEGSVLIGRSLQRQVATYAGGACGTFADDGAASTDVSPITATGLLGGHCYQWIETLSNQSGDTTQTTSGIVRVDLPA